MATLAPTVNNRQRLTVHVDCTLAGALTHNNTHCHLMTVFNVVCASETVEQREERLHCALLGAKKNKRLHYSGCALTAEEEWPVKLQMRDRPVCSGSYEPERQHRITCKSMHVCTDWKKWCFLRLAPQCGH